MLHLHPGLLLQNMGFAARPRGQAHVKIQEHHYIYFVACTNALAIIGQLHAERQIERKERSFRWVFLYGSTGQVRRANPLSFECPLQHLTAGVFVDGRKEEDHHKWPFRPARHESPAPLFDPTNADLM